MNDGNDTVNPARKPVARRLRFEILRRDNYTCRYCGATADDGPLTIDHVIPAALGGGDDPSNLVTACRDCNYGKASTSPDEHTVSDVDETAMLFRRAMARAGEIQRSEAAQQAAIAERFDAVWLHWHYGSGDWKVPRTPTWRTTILNYITAGLTEADLAANVKIAMESNASPDMTWRYFCGVCKNLIAARHEIARRLIEDGQV